MAEGKFDVVLQFGQLDMSSFMASKYLDNEHMELKLLNIMFLWRKRNGILHYINGSIFIKRKLKTVT